jgi:hypothetical protein
MLPTASSKARSMGTFSMRSTCYLSTLSTPAQVDRVRKVRSCQAAAAASSMEGICGCGTTSTSPEHAGYMITMVAARVA